VKAATGAGQRPQAARGSGVEHIQILFSPVAHRAAREWLEGVFGAQPGRWNILTGASCVCLGLSRSRIGGSDARSRQPRHPRLAIPDHSRRRLLSLAGGALGATLAFVDY